ncbi:ankyrin repeat domain-containing protein [Candidatus Micrarchaeota archaeon]|nr:ankyrin repeat domain-containing protein [Candidatus Micrarchaeota archaeon]
MSLSIQGRRLAFAFACAVLSSCAYSATPLKARSAHTECEQHVPQSQLASCKDQIETVRLLVEKGVSPGSLDGYLQTMLLHAAETRQAEIVQLLLERGVDPNSETDGWTPLHHAAANGDVQIISILLQKGAKIEAKDDSRRTALHTAVAYGHLEAVRLLLGRGANPNTASNNSWSPLHSAASQGYTEITLLLLEKSANPNAEDSTHWVPLHYAAEKGNVKLIRALLEKKADPFIKNNDGMTALDLARHHDHPAVVQLLEKAMGKKSEAEAQPASSVLRQLRPFSNTSLFKRLAMLHARQPAQTASRNFQRRVIQRTLC